MEQITKGQLITLHKLLKKLNLDAKEIKREIVSEFSGGRVTSSALLDQTEAGALIRSLAQTIPGDRQRKKIIKIAHLMGWRINGKIDMGRLNGWCTSYGHKHKPLNEYNPEELNSLVSQMEAVYRSFLRDL
jgi:hypothetical protein